MEYLCDSEFKLVSLVWEREPLPSKELVALCREAFSWKPTTTYTILKRVCNKGILQNENSVVTAVKSREEIRNKESASYIARNSDKALPELVLPFLKQKAVSEEEIEATIKLLEAYKREKGEEER